MNLYVESSAVLAWLLGEEAADAARTILGRARIIVSSDLTLVECDRVLLRAAAGGNIREAAAFALQGRLSAAASAWNILRIAPEIVARARKPFPGEPIRTLDALHVAAALFARAAVPDLGILTLDERIRRVAVASGLTLHPEEVA